MTKNTSTGFTLIELVLVVSILSIVLVVSYGTIHSLIRARDVINDNRESSAIANAVLSRMVRELQLATKEQKTPLLLDIVRPNESPPGNVSLLGEKQKSVAGVKGDAITFKANEGGQYLPDGGGHTGIVQITYRLAKDPESPESETAMLIRDEIPDIIPAKEAYKRIMTFPISYNVAGLKFEYYDAENERWLDSWGEDQGRNLPALIHFELALQSPGGRIETYATTVALGGTESGP